MILVPYHLEIDGNYYSLSYVHSSKSEAQEDLQSRDEPAVLRLLELDDDVYGVYTLAEAQEEAIEGGDLSDYSADTRDIVDTVISLFDQISDDQEIEWYKPLEPTNIADAIEAVTWKQLIPTVGGSLISELIRSHGLPNANHRTSIAFFELYTRTFHTFSDAPQTNHGDDWATWANEYIRESKRILTVRRKAALFSFLQSLGATGVRRKNDVVIPFETYPLDVDDPWAYYAVEHDHVWEEFATDYLQRAGASELLTQRDDGKRVFASRL